MGNTKSKNKNISSTSRQTQKSINSSNTSYEIDVIANYTFGKTIGSGISARVVEGVHVNDPNKKVAIKIMDKENNTKKMYHQEIKILTHLPPDMNNPTSGIQTFIGHGEDNDHYYIVSKLLTGGDLFDRIVTKEEEYKITEKVAVKLMNDILTVVKFCHDHNVVNKGYKPEDCIFETKSPDSDLCVIDFGCAKIVEDDEIMNDVTGTPYYISPELAAAASEKYRERGDKVSDNMPPSKPRTGRILKKTDVWAVGVIAYVMMTGRAPFRDKNNAAIFESICTKQLEFPKKDARYHVALKLSPHFKDFVRKTLVKDPEQRISADEALRHPWIQGVDAADYRLNREVMRYLRQYGYQTRLKKEILRVLAANMTEGPTKQVMRHFKRLDSDGDGFLDEQNLTNLLLEMGHVGSAAKEEATEMIKHADRNGDGLIDFEDFKQIWYRKVLATNVQYIRRVFDVFDDNGDGYIDATELGQVLFPEAYDEDGNIINEEYPHLEGIMVMLREVDVDGNGKISFDDFKAAMKEDCETQRRIAVKLTNGYIRKFINDEQGISIPIEINPIIARYFVYYES